MFLLSPSNLRALLTTGLIVCVAAPRATVRAQEWPPLASTSTLPVRRTLPPGGRRGERTIAPSGPLPEVISPSRSVVTSPIPQPEILGRPSSVRPPLTGRASVNRPARAEQLAIGGSRQEISRETLYLLASFSTPYDARIRGRTNNLRMAARLVNGTVVPPGATFSANQAIGPRRAAAGWREAKMFVSGQVVNGVGAGICQCSTTIYNAALLAGLPIVERHPHSFRVDYAPPSRDAAIYWGSKDMRFRNNTVGPIYVRTWLSGGRFHARLLGIEPVRERIQVTSRTLSRRGGTHSEAYRIVETQSGTLRQRLSHDYYKPRP